MKGIVIYSKTGNTKMVAEQIAKSYELPLMLVVPQDDNPNIKDPVLKEAPDITSFDQLIIASPVHGFMLSNVMRVYLEKNDFTGKKVDLFVTHFFPYAWMGANHTLKQMKKLITDQGGEVFSMTSINWKNRKRNQEIDDLVASFKR